MSEYLKFNNSNDIIKTDEIIITKTIVNDVATRRVVLIADQVDKNLSGFVITNKKGKVVNDTCGTFNYLYRDLTDTSGTFVLTDNANDVYTEPVKPEPIPVLPTPIETVKAMKLTTLSAMCESSIVAGVDVILGDVVEHFSYDVKDQSNIDDIFEVAATTSLPVMYHCDNGPCREYSANDVIKIWAKEKMNKNYNTTYYNALKQYVESFTAQEDAETVSAIHYGVQLEGVYLDLLNAAITINTTSTVKYISNISGKTVEEIMEIVSDPVPSVSDFPTTSDVPVVSDTPVDETSSDL